MAEEGVSGVEEAVPGADGDNGGGVHVHCAVSISGFKMF